MLDVQKLERRWLKYKIRKFAPYFLSFFAILIIITAILIWLNHQSPTNQVNIVQKESKAPAKQPQPEPISTVKEDATVLEPSMGFVQNFETSPFPEETPKQATVNIPKQPIRPSASLPTSKPLEMPEYPQPIKTSQIPVTKNITRENSLSINRNDSKLDIDDLKLRFKETSNANLGLFIARYYYDHGDYNEAYNYALKTNTLNSRIDESWIIFSKSLVKLGKTDQAKKTLQLYLSQSNSESARALLDTIERGSFK